MQVRRFALPGALALALVLAACTPAEPPATTDPAAADRDAPAAEAPLRDLLPEPSPVGDRRLRDVVDGVHRDAASRARDAWRNPVETMAFFGLRPDMTVIELWPADGWYTDILAPYLAAEGTYIAAHYSPHNSSAYRLRTLQAYVARLEADPALYGDVRLGVLECADAPPQLAPAGTADRVLLLRNLHNLMSGGCVDAVLAGVREALADDGVLGVVGHRAGEDAPRDPLASDGYVRESHAIELIERAGFELIVTSEVNANPDDPRDHEHGVWVLPPTLRLGETDRERYLAIGESDRFTLKFRRAMQ